MNVLYILPSLNLYGGTPKKTLDLINYFGANACLYVYSDEYAEFKDSFERTGAHIRVGNYGRNMWKHIASLVSIIDDQRIDVVQVQFSMGELIGALIKMFRPNVKLVVAFVGSNEPGRFKKAILRLLYRKVDAFVYISSFVRSEKIRQFPSLSSGTSRVIYNGTNIRSDTGEEIPGQTGSSLLTIGGLSTVKNIGILIEAMEILHKTYGRKDAHLTILGDGVLKNVLAQDVQEKGLGNYVSLVGYHSNVGGFLSQCDIYLHPCIAEGFGIAVAEAMRAEKPVIVANAGALPELVEDCISGSIVCPFDAQNWADAILSILDSPSLAQKLALGAKTRADELFSVTTFVENYEKLYLALVSEMPQTLESPNSRSVE